MARDPSYSLLLLTCLGLLPHVQAQQVIYADVGISIMRFDLENCEVQEIGPTVLGFGDIALTPNRLLYGVSGNAIYQIDTASAEVSYITSIPDPFSAVSLVALDNERLMLESWDSLCVIHLDGTFSTMGHIGYSASGDLTWYQGDLYMTAGYSALIRIQLTEDRTGIAQVDSIGPMETTFGDVYGAVTVRTGPCGGDLRIIAFDGTDVYFVDPANADTEPLCLGAFPFPVQGAATSAETEQPVREPTVEGLNVFTPNMDGVNDRFLPVQGKVIGELSVFNRWGQEVHHGPLSSGWDGRNGSGMACSEGVYYYMLQQTPICTQVQNIHGHVTLVR